jgi:surface protein
MDYMFRFCSNMKQIDLSKFNTKMSKVWKECLLAVFL